MGSKLGTSLVTGAVLALVLGIGESSSAADRWVPRVNRRRVPVCPPQPCPPPHCPPVAPHIVPGDTPPVDPDAETPVDPDQAAPAVPNLPEPPPEFNTSQNLPSPNQNLAQAASTPTNVAPNMIGDFLNSGTTGFQFSTRVQANPLTPGGFPLSRMATGAQLVDGLPVTDASGFGLDLTALDPLGDLLAAGDDTTIDNASLNPLLTRLVFRTSATVAQANSALASSGSLAALEPLTNAAIFLRLQNALQAEFPDLANAVNLEELFEIRLVPEESVLMADGAGFVTATYVYEIVVNIPAPSPGELIGRVTFSDNASPLPRDRFFADFNYFHEANVGPANIPLNRLTLGGEKTFNDGNSSVELRVPMAVTFNSTINTSGTDILNYELGDIGLGIKTIIGETRRSLWSAGLGVTIPTADDFRVNLSNGNPFLHIRNDSVHIQPYLAAVFTPSNDTFFQSFLLLDVDTNGNAVSLNQSALTAINPGSLDQGSLERVGRLQANTLLKLDLQAGYWHFRNIPKFRRFCGISSAATVLEAHLATVVSNPDRISLERAALGEPNGTTVLNATIGEQLYFGPNHNVTIGYGVPLTEDRFFEGELRLFYNRFF